MSLRYPLLVLLVLGGAVTAAAQQQQQVISVSPKIIQGVVVQATPRAVVVKNDDDGQRWTLVIDKNTHVRIKGEAAPEMLAQRTPQSQRICVRFIASIDKHTGKAKDKLDKVTIFTETQGIANRTLGLVFAKDAQPDDEAGPAAAKPLGPPGGPPPGPGPGLGPGPGPGPGQGPGPGPAPGQGPPSAKGSSGGGVADAGGPPVDDVPPIDSKPKRSTRGGKGLAVDVPDVASYEVCGQIFSYHGRRMTVTAPNRFFNPKTKITVELSPDAKILLDLSDLSLVKPGNKVSGLGFYSTPGVCVLTDSVTITLDYTLGARPGRSRRPSSATKSGDAAHRPVGKSKPPTESKPENRSENKSENKPENKSPEDATTDNGPKPDESAKKKPSEKDDINDIFGK